MRQGREAEMTTQNTIGDALGLWSKLKDFAGLVLTRFGGDQSQRVAAALSYTTLLSLVPLMAIAFAVLQGFPVFDGVQAKLQSMLFDNFMPESIDSIQGYLSEFIGKAGGMTAMGIIGLTVTAILLLSTIEQSMNTIFRVAKPRPVTSRLMMFWAVLTLGPMLLGASVSLSTYLYTITHAVGGEALTGFVGQMLTLAPTVLAIFAFTLFYGVVPNRPVTLRHAMIGGVAAGILFALVRKGFSLYVTAFPAYQTIYGAVSAIPIFLVWMYLSWAVVLIGATVTATLPLWGRAGHLQDEAFSPAERLTMALRLLAVLFGAAQKGDYVSRSDLLRDGTGNDRAMTAMLKDLHEANFVDSTSDGRWLLTRDLEAVTLHDLEQSLGLALNPAEVTPGDDEWRGKLKEVMEDATEARSRTLSATVRSLLAS